MRLRFSMLVFMGCLLGFPLLAQVIDEAPPPPPPPPPAPQEAVFKVVEKMPEFPGCESITDRAERKHCSQEKMLTYVYKNVKYPDAARKAGQDGMCVVSFVVDKDGTLDDIRVVRDPGAGLGDAAAAVIHLMNEEGILWNPGMRQGRPVRVHFNLPVRFKLSAEDRAAAISVQEEEEVEDEIVVEDIAMDVAAPRPPRVEIERVEDDSPPPPVEIEEDITVAPRPVVERVAPPPPPPPPPPAQREEIFVVVEDMPRVNVAECEGLSGKDQRRTCANENMVEFISENMNYPPLAKEHGVEGTVVLTFVVQEDGSVSNIRILRDVGAGCGQEAVRLVQLLSDEGPGWIPGKQRGRPVKVQYNLPVKFNLD